MQKEISLGLCNLALLICFFLLTIRYYAFATFPTFLLMCISFVCIGGNIVSFLLTAYRDDDFKASGLYLSLYTVLGIQAVGLAIFAIRLSGLHSYEKDILLVFLGIHLCYFLMNHRAFRFSFNRGTLASGVLVFFLILVLLLLHHTRNAMVETDRQVLLQDPSHPIYEITNAQSTLRMNGFHVPDLSYDGKNLSYHLMFNLVVSDMITLFGINPLYLEYKFIVWFFTINSLALLFLLAKGIGLSKTNALLACFFIFYNPFSFVSGNYTTFPDLKDYLVYMGGSSISYQVVFSVFILAGFLDRRGWVAPLLVLLFTTLFPTRGSTFVPLIAAWGLMALLDFIRRRSYRSGLVFAISLLGASLFIPFLKGAHGQCQWMLAPVMWIAAWDFPGRWTQSLGIYLLSFALNPFYILSWTALALVPKAWETVTGWIHNRNDEKNEMGLFLLLSVAIGILIPTAVTDTVEGNALHFAYPFLFLTPLLAVSFLTQSPQTEWRTSRWVFFAGATAVCLYCCAFGLYKHLVQTGVLPEGTIHRMSRPVVLISCLSAASAFWFFFSRMRTMEFHLRRSVSHGQCILGLIIGLCLFCHAINGLGDRSTPQILPDRVFDRRLVDGLAYIEQTTEPNAVVLFGRHYEDVYWRERKYRSQWFANRFIRTALSGRQTLVEALTYKGICLQPDFLQRTLDNFAFYRNCVQWNPDDMRPWIDVASGYQPDNRKALKNRALLLRPLWINPHYNEFDFIDDFYQQLDLAWDEVLRERDPEEILRQYRIDYVFFERGEKPRLSMVSRLGLTQEYDNGYASLYRCGPPNVAVYQSRKGNDFR